MNIGFDFGTTNSVISFHDAESDTLSCFRSSISGTEYIPTVVEFDSARDRVTIGRYAKNTGDGSANVYGRFKLRLASLFNEVIPDKDKPRTAHEVAVKYISSLFDDFRRSGRTIENVVMTIPQAWYGNNQEAKENIKSLLLEVGLSEEQFRLQSEPVAAAAYFCWQWQNRENSAYEGSLLVIDFGGGTLDVTLCSVEKGNKITAVESFDSACDYDRSEYGHAGSAFLTRVIEILCEENNITLSPKDFSLALNALEERIIDRSDISEMIDEYLIDPEDILPEEQFLFSIPIIDCDVRCEHLVRAFNEVNNDVLEAAINRIMKSEAFDMKSVKVILVGGFSNFCCVENKVREMFFSRAGASDPRFPKPLSDDNKALAIAKGAALIADGRIIVDAVCPYEMGIVVGSVDPDDVFRLVDRDIPLIKRNTALYRYEKPIYSDEKISVMYDDNLYVRFYRECGSERIVFSESNINLNGIFPESETLQEYRLGLSLDEDMMPVFHVRSEDGTERSASLGNAVNKGVEL